MPGKRRSKPKRRHTRTSQRVDKYYPPNSRIERLRRDTDLLHRDPLRHFHRPETHPDDDRRRWQPDRAGRIPRLRDGRLALTRDLVREPSPLKSRIVVPDVRPELVGRIFDTPQKTTVCSRRRERRQSLFAAGRIGSGRAVSRTRVRTPDSDYICRRTK